MISYTDGDLIELANKGNFDVVVHGCNCLSTMGAGIATQMAWAFGCDRFEMELWGPTIKKLGNIDYVTFSNGFTVVNAYTQYRYGRNHADGDSNPFDYEAFTMCMRKMNHIFKGKHIGMPKIGSGLAGGNWNKIEEIIKYTLRDCKVTVVNYKPE